MATNTTQYLFSKPAVGGEDDSWGAILNSNWDEIDALLRGVAVVGVHNGKLDGIIAVNATLEGSGNEVNANSGTLDGMTVTDSDVTGNRLESENEIKETVQALGTATSPAIDPATGGTLITWTLTASQAHTPTEALSEGEYATLLITGAASATITWPTMTWFGGGEPTLDDTGLNMVELFKIGSTLYGVYAGST